MTIPGAAGGSTDPNAISRENLAVGAASVANSPRGPGSNDQDGSDVGIAVDAIRKGNIAYKQAGNYYDARTMEAFSSIRMRRAIARTGMGFRFNFAKIPVDAVANRLELSGVSSIDPDEQDTLDDLWQHNELDFELPNLLLRAGEFGDAYLICWPSPDADGSGDGPYSMMDVHYNSPLTTRVFYDEENPRVKRFAAKMWKIGERYRLDLYYADRIECYVSRASQSTITGTSAPQKATRDNWQRYIDPNAPDDDQEWPIPNPFGEIPVFHFRNQRPYGMPEHHGFFGPQDAINKLIMSHMASVDYQAFPQRYALEAAADATSEPAESDEDEFSFSMQTGKTGVSGADPRSQLNADAGNVWFLKGITEVGQFDQADPSVFTAPMMTYLEFGAQISTTPSRMFTVTGITPAEGTQRMLEGPFIKKVRDRQRAYGAELAKMLTFCLSAMGHTDPDITALWAPAEVINDTSGLAVLAAKEALGVPRHQLLQEAGYTATQVNAWLRFGDSDLEQRVNTLQVLSLAMAQFGSAIAAGALSDEQVQALVSGVLEVDPVQDEGIPGMPPEDQGHAEPDDDDRGGVPDDDADDTAAIEGGNNG